MSLGADCAACGEPDAVIPPGAADRLRCRSCGYDWNASPMRRGETSTLVIDALGAMNAERRGRRHLMPHELGS